MKKTLIRGLSFCLALVLFTGLLLPGAAAADTTQAPSYAGVEPITLQAKSVLLMDMDTEQVLLAQNADERRYPASITKIMTALVTLEAINDGQLKMTDVITVPEEALADITEDSSSANLKAGEEMTVNNLLYCLLVKSANDAANTLAIAVAGDIPTFVEQMNTRAQQLGMEGTHFVNPHGLHNAEHYTTARDIFRMSKEAMSHAAFREIVSTGRYEVPATNLSKERQLLNTNGLLSSLMYVGLEYPNTIGIKTGHTGEAGYCLVNAVKKRGHTLISVVLGCENPEVNGKTKYLQFTETSRLLDWAFDNFSIATLLSAEDYLQEVPVRFSADASHVVLKPTQDLSLLVPGDYDAERLELRLNLASETASAPINAGDVLGTVKVIYNGEDYGDVDMAAVSGVAFSPFMAFVDSVNMVLGNIYVRLLLLAALALFTVGAVRRYLQRTQQTRAQHRQAKLEEKQARRLLEEEQRQKDEVAAEAIRAQRRRQRREAEALHQQQVLERQAQREQDAQQRQAKQEEDRARRQAQRQQRESQREDERRLREADRRARETQREQERRARDQERQARSAQREEERRRQEDDRRRRQAQRQQEADQRRARQEEERRRREERERFLEEERRQWERYDQEFQRRRQAERQARQPQREDRYRDQRRERRSDPRQDRWADSYRRQDAYRPPNQRPSDDRRGGSKPPRRRPGDRR